MILFRLYYFAIKLKWQKMKVAVWDTYVTKTDGAQMHFDIIVPEDLKDESKIYAFGKAYLHLKQQGQQPLTTKECQFCHIEQASEEMQQAIQEKGYFIVEMEGCL